MTWPGARAAHSMNCGLPEPDEPLPDAAEPAPRVSLRRGAFTFIQLLLGLRRHDFRAARTWIATMYPGIPLWSRLYRFTCWSLQQMWCEIPRTARMASFATPVLRTPIWLAAGNPLDNQPWAANPQATLPQQADVVVIGAGFTGASLAYHWSKKSPAGNRMVVLEMNDAASGASGRNEGLVVMGRYCYMVYKTVLDHFNRTRTAWPLTHRQRLAKQFAVAYCKAAYRNADMVEQTIKSESYDCDYARQGWVQARDEDQQQTLADSVALAAGMTDWTSMTPDEVERRTGMKVRHNAGFSLAAATFHPAKWVWSLLDTALKSGRVEFYSRTKVMKVEPARDAYRVHTGRGTIRARHVVSATESYTPLLHPQFHDRILPTQTQAASATGGPAAMRPHVGISGPRAFFGRHHDRIIIGSDATRVPDHEAGRMQPSRFITRFVLGEMLRYFGPYRCHVTHEWSGTVSYTPDEFPVVGAIDGRRHYLIGGMAGSGTGVSFNAARCVVNRILGIDAEPDDYPPEYFSPTRLLDPDHHTWPDLEGFYGGG